MIGYRSFRQRVIQHRTGQAQSVRLPGLDWYGRGESNPRLELGRLSRYHYATPARRNLGTILTARGRFVKFGAIAPAK